MYHSIISVSHQNKICGSRMYLTFHLCLHWNAHHNYFYLPKNETEVDEHIVITREWSLIEQRDASFYECLQYQSHVLTVNLSDSTACRLACHETEPFKALIKTITEFKLLSFNRKYIVYINGVSNCLSWRNISMYCSFIPLIVLSMLWIYCDLRLEDLVYAIVAED